MREIRFNHNYKKLHNQKTAVLAQTGAIKGNTISKEFIDYDTDRKFKINRKGNYLYLLFIGDKMIPFTTLRKLNIENVKKYVGREGDFFNVVIEEQKWKRE